MSELDYCGLLIMNPKILIIGMPRSGKTFLFKKFREVIETAPETLSRFLLQTDDFKNEEWVQQLYSIMDKIRDKNKWIVEGMQGYRLLRKYVQRQEYEFKPDLIIMVSCDQPTEKRHRGMVKTMTKIWKDYVALEEELPAIEYYNRIYEPPEEYRV